MKNPFSSIFGIGIISTLFAAHAAFGALTVLTVPVSPCPTPACTTPANTPHTTYAISSTTEATIIMGATVPSAVGSTDSFTVDWHFGDGSADTTFALTNPYDISTTHQYPPSAGVGTIWTATVTVKDTTTGATGTANYYVIQESNDCTKLNTINQPVCVASRANVAIDWGLWYMHQTMWRGTDTAASPAVNWGGWDTQSTACNSVNGQSYDCSYYGVVDAENVQAFEVNGHLQNGPSTDPYTDDVARGLARATYFIASEAVGTDSYEYDPNKENYTCADHTLPQTTDNGACTGHGGRVYYNPTATTCPGATPSSPCVVTYDGNKNGLMAYSNDGSGELIYTSAPFLDALVASATPTAVVKTGAYAGDTFATVVGDFMDFYGYSQYYGDCDVDSQAYPNPGNTRGNGSSCAGGAWLYSPQEGDDDSTSQWGAIALISGNRGFGISIPPGVTSTTSYPHSITDYNQVWVTNAQDLQETAPACNPSDSPACDPYSISGDNQGGYGYRGSLYYSNPWSPFATTPSGMVQMALDGVGRTTNTTFGDSTTAFDQRWNITETYYADNFCNSVTPYNQAGYAPRAYMYGLFSFTKAMLEHNEAGSLAPIQYLRTLTPNVFSGNPNVPKNTIDWYAALSPADGGKDICDGVAQTLIDYQQTPVYPAVSGSSNFGQADFDGHWFGNTYDVGSNAQSAFETAWALIMLKGTVFVQCVNNLVGKGTPSGNGTPSVTLTWSNQANATSYIVSRSTTSGGPYTEVGTTTSTAFFDRTSGLSNGGTYYYVVLPQINGAEVCQSNQAKITIPK